MKRERMIEVMLQNNIQVYSRGLRGRNSTLTRLRGRRIVMRSWTMQRSDLGQQDINIATYNAIPGNGESIENCHHDIEDEEGPIIVNHAILAQNFRALTNKCYTQIEHCLSKTYMSNRWIIKGKSYRYKPTWW